MDRANQVCKGPGAISISVFSGLTNIGTPIITETDRRAVNFGKNITAHPSYGFNSPTMRGGTRASKISDIGQLPTLYVVGSIPIARSKLRNKKLLPPRIHWRKLGPWAVVRQTSMRAAMVAREKVDSSRQKIPRKSRVVFECSAHRNRHGLE